MSDVPAVSVVIPLYNKGPYIARTLNSVLSQTVQDFEVIVVEDGSTDEGPEIVKAFDDPRILLIQKKERCGVSDARNRGIRAARAEMVAFLDADDLWLPRFLETILRLRRMYPEAGLYGTAYEIQFPGTIVKRVYIKSEGERILESYFGAMVNFDALIFYTSSSAAPKNVLIAVGCFPVDAKWSEDSALWGKIALHFPVAYSPEICSIYNKFTLYNSSTNNEYMENAFVRYLSNISKNELLDREDSEDLLEYLNLCQIAAIQRNIYSGHGKRARSELKSVTSPRYTWRKFRLLLFSYTPLPIIYNIKKYSRELSYIKRRIFYR